MLGLNAGHALNEDTQGFTHIAVAVLRPPEAPLKLSLAGAAKAMQTQHAAVLAALLVASTSALDAAYAPAKLQWQAKTRDTTVLLLTETEGAKQTAQAMWPVGAAIEALLNDFDDAENVICCLPFATGKDLSLIHI